MPLSRQAGLQPCGLQTLCATRPDFQSGTGSWALRAQVTSGGQGASPLQPDRQRAGAEYRR